MSRKKETPYTGYEDAFFRFSYPAMATTFELFIDHPDLQLARKVAHQCFRELEAIERVLSAFVENSDISRINIAEMDDPVVLHPHTLECMQAGVFVQEMTGGAFDITAGGKGLFTEAVPEKKKRQWRWPWKKKEAPDPYHFRFDVMRLSVMKRRPGLHVDLGGIGKGYALDKLVEILNDWEVKRALIHGGQSSVMALDPPDGKNGWHVTISHPATGTKLKDVYLANQAMHASGLQKGDHIINPKTKAPSHIRTAAWCITESATYGDALSTALMVMPQDAIRANSWIQENASCCYLLEKNQTSLIEICHD